MQSINPIIDVLNVNIISISVHNDQIILFNVISVHIYSIIVFFIIFLGYFMQSSLLLLIFYTNTKSTDSNNIKRWKIQDHNTDNVGKFVFHPIISTKPNQGKYHRLFGTMNIITGSLYAAMVTELCNHGYGFMRYDQIPFDPAKHTSANIAAITTFALLILYEFIVIVIYQNIAEYYWHRLMHTKYFYASWHKYHHHYKSPEPFDDMYIHPFEAIGYYTILYAPPFLFHTHLYAFIGYMIVMGVCGVIDHSGIKFHLPGIYNSIDHDNHHVKFEVNYGFPFIYLDILHGTYHGRFCGKEYNCSRRRRDQDIKND